MLAAPVHDFAPPPGWWIEPKWDGFRALLARPASGPVIIRSRQGKDLGRFFPDILAAAAELPPVALDGELVIWSQGRLAFEMLLERLNRPPGGGPPDPPGSGPLRRLRLPAHAHPPRRPPLSRAPPCVGRPVHRPPAGASLDAVSGDRRPRRRTPVANCCGSGRS
ncbi:hypothetical protein AB0F42_06275 [Streptomyces buecherae]|uniref:ATP-dependent DNA ligase n=1 Tax=Streptomyces buecherae TaxID=2763006 RepID=UPI0033FF88F4